MSKTYDIPLRRLIKDIPVNFLRLVFNKSFYPKEAKFLDVKLPKLFEREADLIVEHKGEIYHLELQSTDDPKMGLRMLYYHLLILENYGKIPYQAVVYVGEKPLKRMSPIVETSTLRFEYRLIDLNKVDCSLLLNSPEPSDWVLSILCRMENENRTLKELLSKFLSLPQPKREKYLNYLLHLARLRPKRLNILHREVQKMPITIDLEKDPLFLEGMERGLEKKAREDVINLYKATRWSPEKIAEILKVSPEKVKKWLKEEGLLKGNL